MTRKVKFSAVLAMLCALAATSLLLTPAIGAQENSAASNLILEARRLENEANFDEADNTYRLVIERYPGSQQSELANLALARSLVRRGQPDEALAPLELLIAEHPESPNAAAAAVLQASIKRQGALSVADLEEARTLLSRVPLLYGPEKFTSLDARVEARVRSGEIRLLLGQPDLAALDFLQAIEDEPPSTWLPRAHRGLAEALQRQGEWSAAAEILQRIVDGATAESAEAAIRLTFLHRHFLRPSLEQSPWQSARVISGVAWKKPSIVAAGPDGRVLVYDQGPGLVAELAPDGQVLNRSTSKDIRDLWWGSDGRPYRATAAGARSFDGSLTVNLNRLSDKERVTKNLVAGETGLFGHWLAIDRGQSALMIYGRSGSFAKKVPGQDLLDVALTPRSEILVLDGKAKRVSRISLDFSTVDSISGSWKRAGRIASDAAGNVYVLNTAENRIERFDSTGSPLGNVGPGLPGGIQLRGVEDLSVDGEGRLYLVDSKLAQLIVLE